MINEPDSKVKSSYHLKSSKRKVAQCSSMKYCVWLWEAADANLVVQGNGLVGLNVVQGGHGEHHPAVVVRVTADLLKV